jgi:glycosyltransferase involved in cell wall biosynthesis
VIHSTVTASSFDTHVAGAVSAVSIAMGTYNGERFLEQQLESLRQQTHRPAELVVRDDGSTDKTLELVRGFAERMPFPVHIHRGARLGFGDNFLTAAGLCSSPLVAFCDQDDVWDVTKLARCVAALEDDDVDVVVHASRVVAESLEPTPQLYPDIRRAYGTRPGRFDPWTSIPGFTMVFRRRLLDLLDPSVRPPSKADGMPMSHDEWIYLLGVVYGRVAFLPEVLALYRQHEANLFGFHAGAMSVSLPEKAASRIRKLRAPSRDQARFALLGGLYEEFLRTACREGSEEHRALLAAAADFYRDAGRDAALRAQLHGLRTRPRCRVALVTRLIARSAYRKRNAGGFGLAALARDVLIAAVGVVGGGGSAV